MRVLHLIEPLGEELGPCGTALVADALSRMSSRVSSSAAIIGPGEAERLAQRLGLETFDRLHRPAGRASAGTALRRYLREAGPFDLIHCWSASMLTLATVAAPASKRCATVLAAPASASEAHWVRMVVETSGATLLAASNTIRRAWATAGVPIASTHVLRPGLNFARLREVKREAVRESLEVGPATSLVALVGEPASRVDAGRFGSVLAMVRAMGVDVAGVVATGARRRRIGRAMLAGVGAEESLIVDERMEAPWSILPGCDAAVILGDDTKEEAGVASGRLWERIRSRSVPAAHAPPRAMPGLLSLHWAAAAGLVIVGEASYAVSEIIESSHSGLLVKPGDATGLARRLAEGVQGGHSMWTLRENVRSEAFSYFACSRMAGDLATVYEQIVSGATVEVPPLPVTGGVRFGRPG